MYYHQAGIVPVSGGPGSAHDFPLLTSKVHYDLIDVQSLATLVLTYASNASVATDVNYVCPLPADASICSFRAVIDGKRSIKGIVKEKEKAKAEYDAAVAQGKTAALLEQSNVEVFQISLGNIHPKQVIEIYISFVSLITGDGELDSLRLVFPNVITPRYGTPPNELLSVASRIRPIESALDFSVSIQMTSHIKSITSPSHPISVTLGSSKVDSANDFNPFEAHVALTSSDHLDKDIVIVITCQGLDRPRCTVESLSPEGDSQELTDAYSLTLVPRFEPPPLAKQEYIFLVDRSGSMGPKMVAVRSALQIILRSLPSNDTSFNIFSFGSRHDSLWPSSVGYGAESLKVAAAHVDGMNANYGGTKIQSALDAVFQTHHKDREIPLTVFVLTDGEAYDLNGVQSTVAEHVNQFEDKDNFLRVFCMGIGDSVSRAMCDMIARTGQGAVVYVGENEKPDKKLVGLLRAARGPIITNITIDWGVKSEDAHPEDEDFELVDSKGETTSVSLFDEKAIPKDDVALGPQTNVKLPPLPIIQQAPTTASLPTLYPGFRNSIFSIIKRQNSADATPPPSVRIKGVLRGRAVELEVPVTVAMAPEVSSDYTRPKLLHILAARALVQRFEDEGSKAGIMSDTAKAEVLRVAEKYGIASSETSFVAVDEEGTSIAVSELSKKVDYNVSQLQNVNIVSLRSCVVPLSAPPVRHSMSSAAYPRSLPTLPTPTAFVATAKPLSPAPTNDVYIASRRRRSVRPLISRQRAASPDDSSGYSVNAAQPQDLPFSIESIARHQTFEGSFDGSPLLYKLLVKQDTLPTLPNALQQLGDVGVNIWCTVLCVAFIRTKFPGDESVWELMVEKGERWVHGTLAGSVEAASVPALVDVLKDEAKNYIG